MYKLQILYELFIYKIGGKAFVLNHNYITVFVNLPLYIDYLATMKGKERFVYHYYVYIIYKCVK